MTPSPATRFEAFTAEHLLLIAAFLIVCVALVALGRAHRGTAGELRFRRAYALLIPCFTVPMQVLQDPTARARRTSSVGSPSP